MTTKAPAPRTEASAAAAPAPGAHIASAFVWILIVAGLGVLYAGLGLANPYVGFLADDALYLLMADLLSPWQTATLPVYEHVRAHSQLPSFFPLALGLVGGGSDELPTVRIFVAAAMASAVLVYRVWLGTCAAGRVTRFTLPILFAILPITLLHVIDVWSEGLYICLSLLVLAMLESLRNKQFDPTWCFGLGILVGCTIATRTVGVALIPVMAIACLRARCLRVWLMWPGLALMLAAAAFIDMGQGGTSYGDLLLSRYGSEPLAQLTTQLAANAGAAFDVLPYVLFQWRQPTALQWLAVALVILPGVLGFSACLRRLQPAALYMLGYGAIIAIWPYPQLMDRFMFPLVPLMLFYVVKGGELLGALANRGAQSATVTVVVLIALSAPGIAATVGAVANPPAEPAAASFRTSRYWLDPTRDGRQEQSFGAMQALHDRLPDIAQHVRPDACIHTVLTNLVLVRAKRIARLPPAASLLSEGVPGECDYYYVTSMPFRGKPPMYPYEFIAQHVEVVAVHRTQANVRDNATIVGVLLSRRRPHAAGGAASADFE